MQASRPAKIASLQVKHNWQSGGCRRKSKRSVTIIACWPSARNQMILQVRAVNLVVAMNYLIRGDRADMHVPKFVHLHPKRRIIHDFRKHGYNWVWDCRHVRRHLARINQVWVLWYVNLIIIRAWLVCSPEQVELPALHDSSLPSSKCSHLQWMFLEADWQTSRGGSGHYVKAWQSWQLNTNCSTWTAQL